MGNTIHQLFCTHCTFGTSYFHQREDVTADHVFEYGVRAGSVPRESSRDYFRMVEPYVYYWLPTGTPFSEYSRFSASNTEPRLVYYPSIGYPSIGGLRMMAQCCYRTTDAQGKPGSFFAHVLFVERPGDNKDSRNSGSKNQSPHPPQPPNAAMFSAADCLELWNSSGWTRQEEDVEQFQLKSLSNLSDLNGDADRAISTAVLDRFLWADAKSDAADPFDGHDPGEVIPDRWRRKAPQERQQLVVDTLRGFLKLDTSRRRRETMLLAIEPGVAALVFYGVAKLLPKGGIGDQLSFSTLESLSAPLSGRPSTALAATTFHNPDDPDAELPDEAYKGRGFAINTYTGKRSSIFETQPDGNRRDYAVTVMAMLADGTTDWEKLGKLLAHVDASGASGAAELEACLGAATLREF